MKIIFLIHIFLLSVSLSFAATLGGEEAKGVHIIMGGRQYASLADYQQQQVRADIHNVLKVYQGEDMSKYIDDLQVVYNKKYHHKLGSEEISLIFDQMRNEYIVKKSMVSEISDDIVDEMRQMLKNKHGKGADEDLLNFDPAKVKTLTIDSSGK